MSIPRYAPDLPLPPYSYVPGKFPHPISDPAGHSHGQQLIPPLTSGEHWSMSLAYRYGIDLFNHGYYWEAHEAWESLWHAVGRQGTDADFLKGLIKLAATGVKLREGNAAGVRHHALRALELLGNSQPTEVVGARSSHVFAHLNVNVLREMAQRISDDPANCINTSDNPVVRLYPEVLLWLDPLFQDDSPPEKRVN